MRQVCSSNNKRLIDSANRTSRTDGRMGSLKRATPCCRSSAPLLCTVTRTVCAQVSAICSFWLCKYRFGNFIFRFLCASRLHKPKDTLVGLPHPPLPHGPRQSPYIVLYYHHGAECVCSAIPHNYVTFGPNFAEQGADAIEP